MPSSFVPRTTDQNKRIHGLAHPLGMGKEDLRELAHEISGERTDHTSELSFDEANALIKRLGGEPLPAVAAQSVRSQQRARQKAGVKQIVSESQLRKTMAEWAKEPTRTMNGLSALTERIIKRPWPPRTTEDCNKVLEAIKSMNKRPARTHTVDTTRRAA